MSVLVLLDLRAAFDTVDINPMSGKLGGLTATEHTWKTGNILCQLVTSTKMTHGVPHSSILGPLLFNIQMLPLSQVINNNNISHHTYADDSQMYFIAL